MKSQRASLNLILKGAAWVSLYTGLYRVATLLVSIITAQLLDVTNFGKVSILQSTGSLFIMFSSMGLGTVAIKLVAEKNTKYVNSLMLINFILCLIAASTIFIFSHQIALEIYQDSSLEPLLKAVIPFIFFSGITQIQSSILAGKEEYSTIAKINVLVGVLSLILIFIMVKKFGVYGWVYGLSMLELIKLIAFQFIIRKRLNHNIQMPSHSNIVHVGKLAFPIALSALFILPVNWLLTRELLLHTGYRDVALLNISDQWIAVLIFFPIAIGNAMLPIMSKMQNILDRKRISDLALGLNLILSIVCAVPIIFLAEYLLGFYGTSYISGADVFYYVVPLVVVLSMTNQLNNRVVADGRPSLMMYSNILWLIVCAPVGIYLVTLGMGVPGVLLGRLAAYLSKFLFLYTVTQRGVKS